MPDITLFSTGLFAFVLLLGMKHGLDADHLATIDALTRVQIRRGHRRVARCSGLLFSGGHGLVVLLAAWLMQHHGQAHLPAWLEPAGAWISILFLLLLSIANLEITLGSGKSSYARHWTSRIPIPRGPLGALMIGAAFALSLDTMMLAGWFSLAGARSGLAVTALLTLAFVAGMAATDGLNGLVMSRLICRSEDFAEKARRVFSAAVAFMALLVSVLNLTRLLSSRIGAWIEGQDMLVSLAVVVVIVAAYAIARKLEHRLERASFL